MKGYLSCACGSKETYVSFSGDICCNPCFSALLEKVDEVIDMNARVYADSGGWAVKINGVLKKYFSKYEDFSLTESRAYARKLNSALKSANINDKGL